MEHFAGIDVSLEQRSVCVVDGAGKIVREAKVASEPEALVGFFRGLKIEVTRIGLEAGPLSQWLHAGLVAAGFEVVLLETRHVKAALSAMVVKTDRKDARGIAQLLRMGWFRPVHARSPQSQEVRALRPTALRRDLPAAKGSSAQGRPGSSPALTGPPP
jgi:transposase